MQQRACDACGTLYEPKRANSRFCPSASGRCRSAYARGVRPPATAQPAPSSPTTPPADDEAEDIAPALREEFDRLGVLGMYEARTALKLARQLDSGTIQGAAFTSQSKELDRRVDALRLRGEIPGDPGQAIEDRFEQKRLRLVEGA